MTFIAVDDEPLALVVIEKYASQLSEWKLLSTFTNAIQAIEFIKSNTVDLVVSDINMPDINGLQFVKELKDECPQIIFITAHKEHALEGYELDVTDYIMKPVSLERFQKAMNKAAKIIELKNGIVSKDTIKEVIDHIYVYSEYEQIKIIINDILYIEAMGDYVKIFLSSQVKPVLTLERIKNMMDTLSGNGFLRIHRSYIINPKKVEAKQKTKIRIGNIWLPVGETYLSVMNDVI